MIRRWTPSKPGIKVQTVVADRTNRKTSDLTNPPCENQTSDYLLSDLATLGNTSEILQTVIRSSPLAIIVIDTDYRVLLWNPAAEVLFGWREAEVLGQTVFTIPPDENVEVEFKNLLEEVKKGHSSLIRRTRRLKKDGTLIDVSLSVAPLRNEEGTIIGTVGMFADITEHKQMEEALRQNEERYRTIIENIEDGYYETDLKGCFTFFNDACEGLLGYGKEELVGMKYTRMADGETAKKVFEIFNQVYISGHPVKGVEWEVLKGDGSKGYVEASVSLIRSRAGEPIGFRGIVRDVTARKESEEAIRHLAYHDVLTGLPNRILFSDRLSRAIAQSQRKERKFALLMLDLDNFKDVNDSLGHSMGDRLLRSVGERLSGLLRKVDTVARMGGDEFLILLEDLNLAEDAITIARKILKSLEQPFRFDDRIVQVSTSIGIAVYPDDGDQDELLMRNADAALYCAKREGRKQLRRYLPLIDTDSLKR